MLVRGINRYVPHAFSPDYPDPDCPPHFGLYGTDPQAKPFEKLMKYSNSICHLFEGAVHDADVAIMYHAELEWFDNDRMGMEKIAKALYTRQVDYDIIPLDVLKDAKVENGRLLVQKESYRALYVPGVSKASEDVKACLNALSEKGLPVIFVGHKPEDMASFETVALDALTENAEQFASVRIQPCMQDISIYRAGKDGVSAMMLVNESSTDAYQGELTVPYAGRRTAIDVLNGEVFETEQNGAIRLSLLPGESRVYVFGGDVPGAKPVRACKETVCLSEETEWKIALSKPETPDAFEPIAKTCRLFDITESDERASFAGFVRYKAKFHAENASRFHTLSLGEVGMTASVSINGVFAGETVAEPHVLTVSGLVKEGENEIEIIVANSLAGLVRDRFSTYIQIPQTGLLGPVVFMKD